MKTIERIDKKYRYGAQALLVIVYAYFASVVFWNSSFYFRVGAGVLLVMLTTYLVHFPNVRSKNFLYILILPVYLLLSVLLALKYYLNLSLLFKVSMLLGSGLMLYIVSLVDNIFLVLSEREDTIPLYRAALPWSQILVVTISIPIFAGIFKIPTHSIYQCLVISFFSFILGLYQFWTLRHASGLIPVRGVGIVGFSLLIAFFVLAITLSTSFVYTESFLRALAASSALMFGLFYVSSHLYNSISKRSLIQYIMIILFFITFMLIFPA